ncbi:hypothetical protein EYF80_049796 [Liparis tanakae]|uniref:Uncharacterized protein n=1 Tax=Liparis tanakae TaxID=230148 RepID=A0A4Z2FGZ6_9TELE|nr:hypothetical protein EYF80_049796 [Liparis tanakae]
MLAKVSSDPPRVWLLLGSGSSGGSGSSSGLAPLEGLSFAPEERRFVKVHGSSLPHRQEDLQRRIVQHLAVWKRTLHQGI